MCFIFKRGSISQAGRRGFDPRLPYNAGTGECFKAAPSQERAYDAKSLHPDNNDSDVEDF